MKAVCAGIIAGLLCSAAIASTARADTRLYWVNSNDKTFSFTSVNGGGGDLTSPAGASIDSPSGLAFDLAAGRMYWGNYNGNRISFANLDGSASGDLNTVGASGAPDQGYAWGVAVDPVGRRIYWANEQTTPEAISFANLDGSGGGDVNTAGATLNGVEGVAVDPVAGRIYWANAGTGAISFANLNGTGGGDLNTTGATVTGVDGVAVDAAAGKIYWARGSGISFARLDGTGGEDLNTAGATVNDPTGVAIDSAAGRIYWANRGGNVISFAKLDGSGGGDLPTPESTLNGPMFAVLLEGPSGAGAPTVTGGSTPGSALACSTGTWAPDLLPAFLYRAPSGFAFQWSRDGTDIAGAVSSSIVAAAPGQYACRVTATNPAGAASQTSASHAVSVPSFASKTGVTLRLGAVRMPAAGPLKVVVANTNGFAITGKLSARTATRVSAARKRLIKLAAKRFRVAANSRTTVRLKLPKVLGRLLARRHKLKLRLTAAVVDPAGHNRTVTRQVTAKLAPKRRR